ncbi:MAG: type II toxin-antitoxin system RelE/ParE family toxin [Magnetococcales bacterium]|nr:type II toxin-antitoxin system RelE/ParE family toxin [Magnetococcales bacterium]
MRILHTRIFKNDIKRLHPNQKAAVDGAVRSVVSDPEVGEAKVGDLARVRVYKFRVVGQLVLLAYAWREADDTLVLLALGSHENFYRDLNLTLSILGRG